MKLSLNIPADGQVELAWVSEKPLSWVTVLVVRTGSVPAYTAIGLDGATRRFAFTSLSRHQRYRMALLARDEDGDLRSSTWWSLTPRAGLKATRDERNPAEQSELAVVDSFLCMPAENHLSLWWSMGPGFADQLDLELRRGERVLLRRTVAPELKSLSLDLSAEFAERVGQELALSLTSSFCGVASAAARQVRCVLAPQGEERRANAHLPQAGLVYASLSLEPELRIFDDEEDEGRPATARPKMICGRCGAALTWESYRLACQACRAEYIPNGRGDYLDVDRLRFGTCLCCRPARILIQPGGAEHLVCAHSLKEHIRLPGEQDLRLAEDLPYGLCQCCRPRKPLLRRGDEVRCSSSDEVHRQQQGRWVLVPSQPVFDAAAIDALLDAGLAEICSTGVNRAAAARNPSPARKRRRS